VGDDFFEEDVGERIFVGPIAGSGGVAAVHDHEHGLAFFGGQEVVHDEIHSALLVPAALVLAGAVLEIEDGIASGAVRLVVARHVDICAAGGVGDFGLIPGDADVAVRDILRPVEGDIFFGNFDAAGLLGPAEISFAAGIVDGDSVEEEPVVVEAGNGRRNGDGPCAIVAFGHVEWAFAQAVVVAAGLDLHFFRVGGAEAEGDAEVGMDAGVLCAWHVGGGGNRIIIFGGEGWDSQQKD
jgi:hypothetical protein